MGLNTVRGEQGNQIYTNKLSVILTCRGFGYNRSVHLLNYLGQSFFGISNPGNTGNGIRIAAEIGTDSRT